jgi:hypothetical protein
VEQFKVVEAEAAVEALLGLTIRLEEDGKMLLVILAAVVVVQVILLEGGVLALIALGVVDH